MTKNINSSEPQLDDCISDLIESFEAWTIDSSMPPKLRSANKGEEDVSEMDIGESSRTGGNIPARSTESLGEVIEAYETPVGDDSTQDEYISDEPNPPVTERILTDRQDSDDQSDQLSDPLIAGDQEVRMEDHKKMIHEMIEELRLENRLANETNRVEFQQQIHFMEDRMRRDRAELEVERAERELSTKRIQDELDSLRCDQSKGQKSLETGLMSVENKLLTAITELQENVVKKDAVPRHSANWREREAEPTRSSSSGLLRRVITNTSAAPIGAPSSSSTRLSMGVEPPKAKRSVTINSSPEVQNTSVNTIWDPHRGEFRPDTASSFRSRRPATVSSTTKSERSSSDQSRTFRESSRERRRTGQTISRDPSTSPVRAMETITVRTSTHERQLERMLDLMEAGQRTNERLMMDQTDRKSTRLNSSHT